MNCIRISLLGKLHIEYPDYRPIKIEVSREQELLCYLLLHRSRLHEREKLAGLMWGDSTTAQSKRNLRQTLWHLQSSLNCCAEGTTILLIEKGWIGINLNASLWLDVAIIEDAYATIKEIKNSSLSQQQAQILDDAIKVYRGDLFEGCYQDWCIYERERLQNMYLIMLDHLLCYSEAHLNYEIGLNYGAQILRYDRARERTHRQLMQLHYGMGNRSAAIHQYELCVQALYEELGVTPAANTIDLYHRIRANQKIHPSIETTTLSPTIRQTADDAMFDRLQNIQYSLTNLQNQISQLIFELKNYPETE